MEQIKNIAEEVIKTFDKVSSLIKDQTSGKKEKRRTYCRKTKKS